MDAAVTNKSRFDAPRMNRSRARHGVTGHPRAASIVLAFVMVAAALLQLPGSDVPVVQAQASEDICADALAVRTFDIVAIDIRVVYNHFGDHDPSGRLFVRAEQEQALRDQVAATPFDIAPLAAPLVLRANIGDCVIINLENKLPGTERTGLHVHGVVAAPGQGLNLGNNGDDTIAPGQIGTYKVFIPNQDTMEGAHFLHSHDRFQTRHGMFGALVAEPLGAQWFTPQDNTAPSRSGTQAIIAMPGPGNDFREYVTIYHDEVGAGVQGLFQIDDQGNTQQMPVVSEFEGYGPGTKAINLRSEPFHTRFNEVEDQRDFHDKSQAYGSYTYGDPGIDIPKAYVGDPTKFRMCNAGPDQHHVHHLHGGGDRWRFSPFSDDTQMTAVAANGFRPIKENPIVRSDSDRIDVQNVGPGECFNQEIEGGAGGVQMSVGDFLFHCHIVEHYVAGMFSFWRVFDTLQPGLDELPDFAGRILPAVNSTTLLGTTLPNGTVLDTDTIRPWVEGQLPDQGVRADRNDASVWDWAVQETDAGPLYFGEPETGFVWPNFPADAPGRLPAGERPEILFNQDNARLAYPLLRPHLGDRPPFAAGHGPAPYLNEFTDDNHPFDGLCPADAPAREYKIVAMNAKVPYNNRDVDVGGQIFVHAFDKADVASGAKPAKSLVIRANQGDCVDIVLTSQLADPDSKVNMHIHLVNFDVQASDGVITGLAYEQSVRPATVTGTSLGADASSGTTQIKIASANALREGTTIGVGLTEETVETHKIAKIQGKTVTLETPLVNDHLSGERVGPEFVRYAWYADVDLGVVYWHDHVDGLAGWKRGLFASLIVEPAGSRWCDPGRDTPGPCDEDVLDGHVLDIVNVDPAKQDDKTVTFRETVVQVQENGLASAEASSFNLRNAPLDPRNDGPNPLSSAGNGPPATDLWRTYPGDPVQVRLIYTGQGDNNNGVASRGVSTFAVTGHRFGFERLNPDSRLVDRLSLGISSHHNPFIECAGGGPVQQTGACARQDGDYLYYMTTPDFFDRGAWGILRVFDEEQACPGPDCLQRIPSNPDISTAPLPVGPVRHYDLVTMEALVRFNDGEGTNEQRRIFALASQEDEIEAGLINPEPLVLRALPGETVEISLTNRLNEPTTIHLTGLLCDPQDSYGIPVGDNPAANIHVARDQTKTFRCFADREFTGYIASFGPDSSGSGGDDLTTTSSTSTQSLLEPLAADPAARDSMYGAIIVERQGATFDPATGTSSTVTVDGVSWHERVLLYESQDTRFASSIMPYNKHVEDISAINFRTEELAERVDVDPDQPMETTAFRSGVHGDPETPILTVAQGDNLIVRAIGVGGDQLVVHVVDGHSWKRDPDMAGSNVVDFVTLGPGETSDAWIVDVGQGGRGDYFYANHRTPFIESGQWGILRVT